MTTCTYFWCISEACFCLFLVFCMCRMFGIFCSKPSCGIALMNMGALGDVMSKTCRLKYHFIWCCLGLVAVKSLPFLFLHLVSKMHFLVVAAYASCGSLCPYTMQRFLPLESLTSLISPFLFPKENEVLFECLPMTVEVCLLFLFALLSCCFHWPCFCPPVALLNRFCPLRFLDPLSSFLFLFCVHTCILAAFVLICSHPSWRILSSSIFPCL